MHRTRPQVAGTCMVMCQPLLGPPAARQRGKSRLGRDFCPSPGTPPELLVYPEQIMYLPEKGIHITQALPWHKPLSAPQEAHRFSSPPEAALTLVGTRVPGEGLGLRPPPEASVPGTAAPPPPPQGWEPWPLDLHSFYKRKLITVSPGDLPWPQVHS